jgi:hypothetical protein
MHGMGKAAQKALCGLEAETPENASMQPVTATVAIPHALSQLVYLRATDDSLSAVAGLTVLCWIGLLLSPRSASRVRCVVLAFFVNFIGGMRESSRFHT